MKKYILTLVTGVFLLLPLTSQAQLLKVKQTVFGMDCAPCAYGLEKRIQQLDGVQSATVSLNNGLLIADLKENNQLTLKRIRDAVVESGFLPKKAIVTVAGKITRRDTGEYILKTDSGERFVLETEKNTVFNKTQEMNRYTVTGKAEINNSGDIRLSVQDIEKGKT